MTLIIGFLILANIVGFQWVLFSSIARGKKMEEIVNATLKNAERLKKRSRGTVSFVFEQNAMVA